MNDSNPIIELPVSTLIQSLEAMSWTISPHLDDPGDLDDKPWIIELISAYNKLVRKLPLDLRSQWEEICY